MRTPSALLIVLTLAASMAACGQPSAVESGTGAVVTGGEGEAGTVTSPVTPPDAATPTSPTEPTTPTDDPTTTTPTAPNTPPPATTGLCGTTATAITYAGQAASVIQTNCTICHAGGTSPKMTDYNTSKAGFSTGGGSTAVANGVMPISITLSANDKCILTQWAANNYAP